MAKRKDCINSTLNSAKKAKNDEFYTQLPDIEREVSRYESQLKGKVIFCNCDDPYESFFFKYFALNFNILGLRKLIATCYVNSSIADTQLSLFDHEPIEDKTTRAPHKIEIVEVEDYDGDGAILLADVENLLRNRKNVLTRLKGDGDFRSQECIELLKQSDVVITNPPFSLFREYIAQLIEYEKSFLIIGSLNAITYKEIFKLIQDNKLWLGYGFANGNAYFRVMPDNIDYAVGVYDQETGLVKFRNVHWFTNLDTTKRHEVYESYKNYSAEEHPKYDNYDAIEVPKLVEIPLDYDGVMGVPITFVDKYNPNQFEIIGQTGVIDPEDICIEYKGGRPYLDGKRLYSRILIRKKR